MADAWHGPTLTDETVALDLRSSRAVPYPKAITLDPGSWPHFARLETRTARQKLPIVVAFYDFANVVEPRRSV